MGPRELVSFFIGAGLAAPVLGLVLVTALSKTISIAPIISIKAASSQPPAPSSHTAETALTSSTPSTKTGGTAATSTDEAVAGQTNTPDDPRREDFFMTGSEWTGLAPVDRIAMLERLLKAYCILFHGETWPGKPDNYKAAAINKTISLAKPLDARLGELFAKHDNWLSLPVSMVAKWTIDSLSQGGKGGRKIVRIEELSGPEVEAYKRITCGQWASLDENEQDWLMAAVMRYVLYEKRKNRVDALKKTGDEDSLGKVAAFAIEKNNLREGLLAEIQGSDQVAEMTLYDATKFAARNISPE